MLGSINLSEFVTEPFTENAAFNYNDFKYTVEQSVIALNEVLDEGLPLHPLQEQRDSVRDWRQIGLGVMGIADMLIKLGITYGSPESIDVCNDIAFTMSNKAIKTSARLAKEQGCFPKCNIQEIISTPFFIANTDIKTRDLVMKYGLRNSQLLTIAPTGTLSTMLAISGGIEPIYANYYTRKTESLHGEDVYYKIYTPIVQQYINKNKTEDLPQYFVESKDLTYKQRIDMQAAWQSRIDASISSTVNLPNEATIEDVENLYLYAWQKGLKGITIFRDGCKRVGILTTDKDVEETNDSSDTNNNTLKRGDIISTNDDLLSYKRTIINGCGKFYLHSDFDEFTGEQLETFIDIGSQGGCERNLQFISRLISLALRSGVPVDSIIDQAMSIRPCTAYVNRTKTKGDTSKGTSCPSAIGYALKELNEKIQDRCFCEEDIEDTATNKHNTQKPKCPDCGEDIVFEGGCNSCKHCGWSKCS